MFAAWPCAGGKSGSVPYPWLYPTGGTRLAEALLLFLQLYSAKHDTDLGCGQAAVHAAVVG